MRLTLCRFITPTWEDVALEVAVSSLGYTYLQDTLSQVVVYCRHDCLILWSSGRVSASVFRCSWFDLQWWRNTICTADETPKGQNIYLAYRMSHVDVFRIF